MKEKNSAATATAEAPAKTEPEQTKDLAETGQTAVDAALDMSADAGFGMENVAGTDMSVPFIVILQKGSPQVDDASPKKIEGAVAGMFMNNVTGELFSGKDGITAIPCGFEQHLVQWKPRDSGGGLVGHISPTNPVLRQAMKNEKNQLVLPNGDIVVDTSYHFVLVEHKGTHFWSIISFASTQKKKSRNWNFAMRSLILEQNGKKFNPPTFSHRYKITTVPEAKDKYTWWGFKIDKLGILNLRDPDDAKMYKTAKEFSKLIADHAIQISAPPQEFESDAAEPEGEKLPF